MPDVVEPPTVFGSLAQTSIDLVQRFSLIAISPVVYRLVSVIAGAERVAPQQPSEQPPCSSPNGHDLCTFQCQAPRAHGLISETTMPMAKHHALTILGALDDARSELVGKAVILTDGKAGTVENVWLDEEHGLRISIRGHDGKWPVSTIKFAQS